MFPPAPWPTNWDVLGSASTEALCCCLSKTSWGFDLQIISTVSTLQCTNLWILKILKLIFSASKGIKNRFQCDCPPPGAARGSSVATQRSFVSTHGQWCSRSSQAPGVEKKWHKKLPTPLKSLEQIFWLKFAPKKKTLKKCLLLEIGGDAWFKISKEFRYLCLDFHHSWFLSELETHCNPRNGKWRTYQLTISL